MTDVLIRDVAPADLQVIRNAAAEKGISLQAYLKAAMHAQAVHVRRQDALARAGKRLEGTPEVPESERAAVLQAIADENEQRAQQLGKR
jgi:hypothetical protein